MGKRAKFSMYNTVQSRFDLVFVWSSGNLGANWAMICYLLDGGSVFSVLWTISCGHGYV